MNFPKVVKQALWSGIIDYVRSQTGDSGSDMATVASLACAAERPNGIGRAAEAGNRPIEA
jgi:hypothetical protein